MTDEEQKMIEEYKLEVQRCFYLAQKLDAYNKKITGVGTGTPSERIERQLIFLGAPGFTNED